MNDIDSRLRGLASQAPRRPLTHDFTDAVMQRAATVQRRHPVAHRLISLLKGFTSGKVLRVKHASLLIGIVVALIVSGAAFAAIRWAGFDNGATYGDIMRLSNGNVRFWVHNDECSGKQGRQFYEIKARAAVTPAQIADMVAGTCEYTDPTALFPGIQIGGTKPSGATYEQALQSSEVLTQYYAAQGTIQAISSSTLTVEFSLHDGKRTVQLPLADGIRAFDKSKQVALQSLKAGTPVALILTTQATYATIAHHTASWQDSDHTVLPNSLVHGVIQEHHQIYDLSAQGKEFTPLVPNPKDLQGMTPGQAAKYTADPAHLHQQYPLE